MLAKLVAELQRYYFGAEKRLPHNLFFRNQARRLYGQLPYDDVLAYVHRMCAVVNYLEIGIDTGKSLSLSRAKTNVGVDPSFAVRHPLHGFYSLHRTTSDQFFASYTGDAFDFIFIDGLHVAEQVSRDIFNSLRLLKPGGIIAIHDTVPYNRIVATRTRYTTVWTGNVHRAVAAYVDKFGNSALTLLVPPTGLTLLRPPVGRTGDLSAPIPPWRESHESCMRRILTGARRIDSVDELHAVVAPFLGGREGGFGEMGPSTAS
jgi:hypothetical protein